jgi:FkbM family methyltransferase
MKKIKALLLAILGQRNYLQLTSSMFFNYFNWGLLKNKPNYYSHHFVKNLIHQGNTVIDIGGNLGYFTKIFSALVGPQGKVYTVEPIALYRSILQNNIKQLHNITILPYALGETNTKILMGNPSSDKHRHGLMRILNANETQYVAANEKYEVEMKHPLELFAPLGKIDYIKCDIEGYEIPVIPLLEPLIANQQPIMQIETEGENKRIIMELMKANNYQTFYANATLLVPVLSMEQSIIGDLIFIPNNKINNYKQLIKN